jgi:hypothetical protein
MVSAASRGRRVRQLRVPNTVLVSSGDELRIIAAKLGRFYGDGLSWALALPVDELIRWHHLIPTVMEKERVR